MSNYDLILKGLDLEFKILLGRLKEIYPVYQTSKNNTEIQNMYNKTLSGIQKIFSQLESINMNLDGKNIKKEVILGKLNEKLEDSKYFLKEEEPLLKELIDNNSGAEPREEEIQKLLTYEYIDFAYIIILLGAVFYLYRKLLKS